MNDKLDIRMEFGATRTEFGSSFAAGKLLRITEMPLLHKEYTKLLIKKCAYCRSALDISSKDNCKNCGANHA